MEPLISGLPTMEIFVDRTQKLPEGITCRDSSEGDGWVIIQFFPGEGQVRQSQKVQLQRDALDRERIVLTGALPQELPVPVKMVSTKYVISAAVAPNDYRVGYSRSGDDGSGVTYTGAALVVEARIFDQAVKLWTDELNAIGRHLHQRRNDEAQTRETTDTLARQLQQGRSVMDNLALELQRSRPHMGSLASALANHHR